MRVDECHHPDMIIITPNGFHELVLWYYSFCIWESEKFMIFGSLPSKPIQKRKDTMLQKKHLVIALVLVMIAITVLAVNTALTASFDKVPPVENHPPACYVVNSFAPGPFELRCTDAGKDITNVVIKTSYKYELSWDNQAVSLLVYATGNTNSHGTYTVRDKSGNVTSGRLP
ncbi:MAG: hypothetical protein WAM60_00015 [Candidatus Promineifilaceae bacterium]